MKRFSVAAAVLACAVPAYAVRSRTVLAEGWRVKQLEPGTGDPARLAPDSSWMAARMPAQVHEILLAKGLISDPRVSRNAAQSAWVGQKEWAYACQFKSPAKAAGPVFLEFQGLDTLATAYLNGRRIGSFDNMFRVYRVDVREQLAPPDCLNSLLIAFASPLKFIDEYHQPPAHAKIIAKYKYLRKTHSDFGSYLGAAPNFVKVGVYRDVVLDVPDRGWIEDVWVRPELTDGYRRAALRVRVETKGSGGALRWALTDPSGREQARGTAPGADFRIDVADPKLWWPRTHGLPSLYKLRVDLGDGLDSREVSVGLREVKTVLRDPATGEKRFRFEVNGRPIYMLGADWAPLEGMTNAWNSARARTLLDIAEHGRMNVIRVWAEGHIPPREFYDECDRRGIFVWQDFMFGYGPHPADDPKFLENARAEIEDVVTRLRNHSCILLWVGGNENHMGADFGGIRTPVGAGLFERTMPETVKRLDPDRHFHPSSPWGGPAPNWPLEGDWHDYTTLTFSPEASVPAYASEVGRASAPALNSMRRFLSPDELWPSGFDARVRVPGKPAWPPMWQYRSVGGSWDKVGPVEQYPDPVSAEDLIRVLGTAHGEYLRQRVERQRRGVPDGAPAGQRRNWGNMVWRLNDSWPILYWSVIDYYLEPKIAFYFLRRAYDPVLVSVERTPDRLFVWVTNDSGEPVSGTLNVQRVRLDGAVRGRMEAEVRVAPGEAKRCLDLTDFGPISLREEFLRASFAGRDITQLLIGERYLHLPDARLTAHRKGGRIEIATDRFARQVAMEFEEVSGAVLEDNFFDLAPGASRTVRILQTAGGKRLRVKALNAAAVWLEAQ
ncbi:MAG: hypothetical protein HY822_19600 [Acidobacteria bacterium]|nr:hypothetical protein [Acidobacteriota bacterium]